MMAAPAHSPWDGDTRNDMDFARWVGVSIIVRACVDLQRPPASREDKSIRQAWMDWAFLPDSDFAEICDLAGRQPETVRGQLWRIIEGKTAPIRSAAGKGKRYLQRKRYREKKKAKTPSPAQTHASAPSAGAS